MTMIRIKTERAVLLFTEKEYNKALDRENEGVADVVIDESELQDFNNRKADFQAQDSWKKVKRS